MYAPFSPCFAPASKNCSASVVFPLPGGPCSRHILFRGNPPLRIESSSAIPETAESGAGCALTRFFGIRLAIAREYTFNSCNEIALHARFFYKPVGADFARLSSDDCWIVLADNKNPRFPDLTANNPCRLQTVQLRHRDVHDD